LLLEDLSWARLGDQVRGCTPEDADAVLRHLAVMHSKWWGSDRLAELAWLPPPADPARIKRGQEIYLASWETFAQRFGDQLPPGVYEIGERFGPHAAELVAVPANAPMTLVHGDCRLGNLFFSEAPGRAEVIAVDWQLLDRRPATWDVAYFLMGNLWVDDRRRHEDRLLRGYHAALADGGVLGYSFDLLIEHYRRSLFSGLLMWVNAMATVDTDVPGGRAMADALLERLAALVDWDCGDLIPD